MRSWKNFLTNRIPDKKKQRRGKACCILLERHLDLQSPSSLFLKIFSLFSFPSLPTLHLHFNFYSVYLPKSLSISFPLFFSRFLQFLHYQILLLLLTLTRFLAPSPSECSQHWRHKLWLMQHIRRSTIHHPARHFSVESNSEEKNMQR